MAKEKQQMWYVSSGTWEVLEYNTSENPNHVFIGTKQECDQWVEDNCTTVPVEKEAVGTSISGTEVPKKTIIITEGEKVIEIDWETLRQTEVLTDAFKRLPAHKPVKHYDFIQAIVDVFAEEGLQSEVDMIYVVVDTIDKMSEETAKKENKDRDLAENTVINDFICRVHITNPEVAEQDWNLGCVIGYNEAGIEIGFGANVRTCRNLCLLGKEIYHKNYGPDKIDPLEMIDIAKNWAHTIQDMYIEYKRIIDTFKAVPIDWKWDTDIFIGRLHLVSIMKNYFKGNIKPFNTSGDAGIVGLQKERIAIDEQRDSDIIAGIETTPMTMWDLYNLGTYILSHNTDLEKRHINTKIYGEWFMQFMEEWKAKYMVNYGEIFDEPKIEE